MFTIFLAYVFARVAQRRIQGERLLGGEGPPLSLTTRAIWICGSGVAFIACVGYALACLTEILAEWARSAADSAVSNVPRWRLAARVNAICARVLARISGGVAAAASVVALIFGWCPLGDIISSRAHRAGDVAHAAAREARAAACKGST
ncbi:hypothetical protein GCM10010214_06610 [Streptomyces abikoensis]|nr:hypothetical protein GCM10010214_06610 [Streptomyces abikoensis]